MLKPKQIFPIVFSSIILTLSCSSPELESSKKKLGEIQCKAEVSKEILENGVNQMALGQKLGLQKELDVFNHIQSDSTVSCDSLKKAWRSFSDLVYEKSKNN